jgi:hypothetical protein
VALNFDIDTAEAIPRYLDTNMRCDTCHKGRCSAYGDTCNNNTPKAMVTKSRFLYTDESAVQLQSYYTCITYELTCIPIIYQAFNLIFFVPFKARVGVPYQTYDYKTNHVYHLLLSKSTVSKPKKSKLE